MQLFLATVFPVIIYQVYFNLPTVQAELKLVNVVFRHGDRAPTRSELDLIQKNFHSEETFYPVGFGHLNNRGKLRMFHLGQYLRERYNDFLGDVYLHDEVVARSTDVDRTKESLQLVLAGLYPPEDIQKWNDELNWQPIATDYLSLTDDILMVPQLCPDYAKARNKVDALPEVRKRLLSFNSLTRTLSSSTGHNIESTFDMYALYHALMNTRSMGLNVPSWTKGIFPCGKLRDATLLQYQLANYDDRLKKLNGGVMIRKIVENMRSRVNNELDRRRIYLYSGHETNVAAVLHALGVHQHHIPRFASGVIVELHEDDDKYYVRIVYYKGLAFDESIDEQLYIPDCGEKCPVDDFERSLRNVTASDEDVRRCDKLRRRDAKPRTGREKVAVEEIQGEDSMDSWILH